MYPSLRVECTEGKIQSMGNVPPVGFGPASMKPLNLQIQSGMGTSITAKGDRLTKFSAEFPIVFAYVNGTHFVHETGPSTWKMIIKKGPPKHPPVFSQSSAEGGNSPENVTESVKRPIAGKRSPLPPVHSPSE